MQNKPNGLRSQILLFHWLFLSLTSLSLLVLLAWPTLSALASAAYVPSAGPDLMIESITVNPANPGAGDTADITVVIKNQGDANAAGFYAYLYVNPVNDPPNASTSYTTHTFYGLGLAPGGTITLKRTGHLFSQANPKIYAWVDRDNQVAESDESNNLYPPPPTAGPDAYENDDQCATAQPISTDGVAQDHNLYRDPDADVDWVKFNGVAGTTYLAQSLADGADADLSLSLFANCENSFGSGAELQFSAEANGEYEIRVAHNQDNYGSDTRYRLVLSVVGGATPSPTPTQPGDTPTATPTFPGDTPTPTATATSVPPTVTSVPPTPSSTPDNSQYEASISLRPNPDGYSFENWGDAQYDDSTDLDNATLMRMFGGSNVCQSGSTPNDCVLSAAARQWRSDMLASMTGGHCYGFAAASQLFYIGLENPGDYQSGAANTFALNPSPIVRGEISELWTTQLLVPADGSSPQWIWQGKKPSEMLDIIRQQLRNKPGDPYVLGFFRRDGQAGHAVTPYAIENKGNGIYWLWIYDNNWPDVPRYFIFDVNQETWRYDLASTDPNQPVEPWEGDATTESLEVRPTTAHLRTGWACPFCGQSVSASGVYLNNNVEFQLRGQGQMLVVDSQGHKVGYDATQNSTYNQIDGAEMRTLLQRQVDGQGRFYRMPLQQANSPYTVFVSGKNNPTAINADLTMNGPGYVMGLKSVHVNPNQNLKMTMRPDGRQITFNASESSVSPAIFLALDHGPNGHSYRFSVDGFELSAFKTVTVTLDLERGLFTFQDNDESTDQYHASILRITTQGEEQNFQSGQLTLSPNQDAVLHFGTWNGNGGMQLTLGGLSTTAINTFTVNKVYLPTITR